MTRAQLEALATRVALTHGVPPELVRAVVRAESNWDPRAYRAEPQIQDASRGLMQVLERTARGLGYSGPVDQLYDPLLSLTLGTKLLARNYAAAAARFPDPAQAWEVALSAYNAGFSSARPGDAKRNSAGELVNASYVNKILGWARAGGFPFALVLGLAGIGWLAWRASRGGAV